MSNVKLYRGTVKLALAAPEVFANWQTPTAAELNDANLVWDVTCAASESGTKFDLGDSDTDNSLTFCSNAGATNITFANPDVVYEINRATDPIGTNQANTAFGLLAFPDIEYFAILRLGKSPDVPFAVGDRVSLVRVHTDYIIDNVGSGNNVTATQTFLPAGDINWNYIVAA